MLFDLSDFLMKVKVLPRFYKNGHLTTFFEAFSFKRRKRKDERRKIFTKRLCHLRQIRKDIDGFLEKPIKNLNFYTKQKKNLTTLFFCV